MSQIEPYRTEGSQPLTISQAIAQAIVNISESRVKTTAAVASIGLTIPTTTAVILSFIYTDKARQLIDSAAWAVAHWLGH